MKRSGPPKRRTPLQAKQGLARAPMKRAPAPVKPRKAIPVESAAKRRERSTRRALVGRLAAEGVGCEVCPELAGLGIVVPGGCGGLGGLHERRKRSAAGSVTHAPNLIPCCNPVNGWIEYVGNQQLADRAGPAVRRWLVVVEGDPDWDDCGRDTNPAPVVVKLCVRCGYPHVTVAPSGRLPCGHHYQEVRRAS